jgi:hypothetical protein
MSEGARGRTRWWSRSMLVVPVLMLAVATVAGVATARQRDSKKRAVPDPIPMHMAMHLDTTGCGARGSAFTDTARGNAAVRDCHLRVHVRQRLAREERRLTEASWSFPEAHDEQRFMLANGEYGPMTFIFASPQLGAFRHAWQVTEHEGRGLLVAVVYVEESYTGALDGDYASLQLRSGINCLFLTHQEGTDAPAWQAHIMAASASGLCTGATGPRNLAVVRQAGSLSSDDDYPPAARFTESRAGRPLFGVRCLSGWCDIGTPQGDGVTPAFEVRSPATKGVFAGREASISAWHDEQLLSAWRGGKLVRTTIRATIVPAKNLEERPATYYKDEWQAVATITLSQSPGDSKYARWGLRSGRNTLWLIEQGGTWRMKVARNESDPGTVWSKSVDRIGHFDAAVPGTARFRFNSYDDGVWIPCGAACCYAEGDA